MIKLRITPDGRIQGLWTDHVRFSELGLVRVQRVSHVEFDERAQCWDVCEAAPLSRLRRWLQWLLSRPMGRQLHTATSRARALIWEHDHFQPGSPGWGRLRK